MSPGVDNAEKLEFMRSLGADHVIDYTREDFTRNGRTYDLILDLAAHRSVFAYRGSLTPGGRYLYVGGSMATLLQILLIGPLIGRAEGKKLRLLVVRLGVQHLAPIVELCQAGKIAIFIDRRYQLSDVPEAMRYLGEGHAKGKVLASSPSSLPMADADPTAVRREPGRTMPRRGCRRVPTAAAAHIAPGADRGATHPLGRRRSPPDRRRV